MSTCEGCEDRDDMIRQLRVKLKRLMPPEPGPTEALSERIAGARQAAIKKGYAREALDEGRQYCPTAEVYAERLEALAKGPKLTERYRNSIQDTPEGRLGFNDPDDAFELFRG